MDSRKPAKPNEFALAFTRAHEEVGLSRIQVAQILRQLNDNPGYLFSPELRHGAGQCPVGAHGLSSLGEEDADRITVNSLLAYLFNILRDHIARQWFPDSSVTHDRAPSPIIPRAPRSPHDIDPGDAAAMAAAPASIVSAVLRDASCHVLDGLIGQWAVALITEEERCRLSGDAEGITTEAAATFVLRTTLEGSSLYQRAGYDLLSITKTGSHTAVHICWSLVEAAPMLRPDLGPVELDALVRASLKRIIPLSMASLGMLVHYMESAGIEPHDGLAIHPLLPDQKAFVLEKDGLIGLACDPITSFAKPDEGHYTGCPAFYTPGLMKLYLDIVAGLARDHGLYAKLLAPESRG